MVLTYTNYNATLSPVTTKLQDYYTPKQAAAVLNVHRTTIHRWITDGKLKTAEVAAMRLIPGSEVARLMKDAKND